MANFVLVLALGVLAYGAWCLIKFVVARNRMRSLRRLGASLVAFLVLAVVGTTLMDREAAEAGFTDWDDQQEAENAGYTDADAWADAQADDGPARAVAASQAQPDDQLSEADRQAAELRAEAERRAAEEAATAEEAEQERLAAQRKEQERREAELQAAEAAAEAEACRQDLSCWGEKVDLMAQGICEDEIEKLARYDYEWTDGWLGIKFTHYRWADKEQGVVTIIGDSIKFQNGFGAWQNHIYECDTLPETELVFEVRAQPGRL